MSWYDEFKEDRDFNYEKETVDCEVEYCSIEDEYGREVLGVRVTCNKCGHSEESFGQSEKSIKRCLYLLHENCPNNEDNWYEIE